jgi:hypothetical protein
MNGLAVVKRAVNVIALGLLASFSATSRAADSADYTDTWWNPNESGWGMQVVQQVEVMYATLYVYDHQGSPDWYGAAIAKDPGGTWKGDPPNRGPRVA